MEGPPLRVRIDLALPLQAQEDLQSHKGPLLSLDSLCALPLSSQVQELLHLCLRGHLLELHPNRWDPRWSEGRPPLLRGVNRMENMILCRLISESRVSLSMDTKREA